MKQEIRFKGLNLSGDERSAQPGELALCAGVELQDGSLRPSVLSGSMIAGGAALTGTLLYVHQTQSYTHFITYDDTKMYFAYVNLSGTLVTADLVLKTTFDYTDIRSIESIGNTLIILTPTGLHYFLYKADTDSYKHLGNRIPFVRLQFRPSVNYKALYDMSTVDATNTQANSSFALRAMNFNATDACSPSASAQRVLITSEKQADVTDAVWACINQANDTIAKDGHFYAPFMVRYCYRLYDGSMIMHSAPVFMNVALPLSYLVYSDNVYYHQYPESNIGFSIENNTNAYIIDGVTFRTQRFTARYHPNNIAIEYRLVSTELTDLRNNWSDIVKSVDIFITPPIVREDSSKKIESMIPRKSRYGVRHDTLGEYQYPIHYYDDHDNAWYTCVFDIPLLSEEAYVQKIRDNAAFFKIKSFNLDETFSDSWAVLNYDKSVIPNLTTQEQMTDDYKTHNALLPVEQGGGMYTYNHRLNVFGIKEQIFKGFQLTDMVNQCNQSSSVSDPCAIIKVVVELNTEEGKKFVEINSSNGNNVPQYVICNACLFYPDSRAVRMAIKVGDMWKIVKMEPCNFLNGAMSTELFLKLNLTPFDTAPSYSVKDTVNLLNRIYTSEVNNPYYFPLEGINTVGVGTIKGLAATTRALSQGQFGQYPLIAFCTDGIWALEVSKDNTNDPDLYTTINSPGTFSRIHPISREVCVNPDSICQLDQSVMFATDRALSRVVESSVVSCSDMLNGPVVKCGEILPGLIALFLTPEPSEPANEGTTEEEQTEETTAEEQTEETTEETTEEEPSEDETPEPAPYESTDIVTLLNFSSPPIDYFKQGRLLYDFTNSRVIVLPPSLSSVAAAGSNPQSIPVYVFSTRDLSWSTMLIPPIKAALNSYPYPYVQKANGSLMVLDTLYSYTDTTPYPGIIVTRTLSYESLMHVIQAYAQINNCENPQLLIIYGSNDLRQWHYVGRSQRSHNCYLPAYSFRYFRIAIYLQMLTHEKYSSLILDIIEKYRKL